MSTHKFLPVAALAALCSFLPVPSSAAAPALAEVIGVVDLARAFKQYPKWIESQKQLTAMEEGARAQMAEVTKRIDEAKATLLGMKPDAPDRRRQEFMLELNQQERTFLARELTEKVELENMRADLDCYEDMEVAIAAVARAKGIKIVHRLTDLGPKPAGLKPREVQARLGAFERKQVWYHLPEIDITADLIKELMVVPVPANASGSGGAAKEGAAKENRGGG